MLERPDFPGIVPYFQTLCVKKPSKNCKNPKKRNFASIKIFLIWHVEKFGSQQSNGEERRLMCVNLKQETLLLNRFAISGDFFEELRKNSYQIKETL